MFIHKKKYVGQKIKKVRMNDILVEMKPGFLYTPNYYTLHEKEQITKTIPLGVCSNVLGKGA